MTEKKTPARRVARPQPTKTGSVAKSTSAKPVGAAQKGGARKATPPQAKIATSLTAAPARKAAPTARVAKPASAKAKASPVVAKPKAAPREAAKPAAAVAAPSARDKPVVSARTRQQPKGDSFKLRMLVDQVVKTTGSKKKGVKELVEATLSRLGEALARGDELNLPGFGKVRIVKTDDRDGTAIMTLKLRQGAAKATAKPGQKGLADSGDDD